MLERVTCMFDDVCSSFFVGRMKNFLQHTTNVEACSSIISFIIRLHDLSDVFLTMLYAYPTLLEAFLSRCWDVFF